jgi:VanZ family protein
MRFSAAASQILAELSVAILITAWGCVALIGLFSLLPRDAFRVDLSGHAKHVLAYMVAAVLVGTAYRNLHLAEVFVALAAYAACLEYLQRFSPGRTSSLRDFVFSALGVALGVALLVLIAPQLSNNSAPEIPAQKKQLHAPSCADRPNDHQRRGCTRSAHDVATTH